MGDKMGLFAGGWDVSNKDGEEKVWKEKYDEYVERPKTRLPKWCGERPGKKAGDPETPEGEEVKQENVVEDDDELEDLLLGKAAPPTVEAEEEEEEEERRKKKRKKRRRKKRK